MKELGQRPWYERAIYWDRVKQKDGMFCILFQNTQDHVCTWDKGPSCIMMVFRKKSDPSTCISIQYCAQCWERSTSWTQWAIIIIIFFFFVVVQLFSMERCMVSIAHEMMSIYFCDTTSYESIESKKSRYS